MTPSQIAAVAEANMTIVESLQDPVRAAFNPVWMALNDIAHPAPRVVSVPAGVPLQPILDIAGPDTIIELEPRATYDGNFVIRHNYQTLKTAGTYPMTRLGPDDGPALAGLRSPSNAPALRSAPGLVGFTGDLLRLESLGSGATLAEFGTVTETDSRNQPSGIRLQRIFARGVDGKTRRALSLHGSDMTVAMSHLANITMDGAETQAIWACNGRGPYDIHDNYLEASGENVMFGGDDPRILGLVPADILIYGNNFRKPLEWRAQKWDVKNLLEFKNARRVLVDGNEFDGCWSDAQTGWAILMTPRNQYGRAPWSVVEDVLFTNNIIRNVANGLQIQADDDESDSAGNRKLSQRVNRVRVMNNLWLVDKQFGKESTDGRAFSIGRGPQLLQFDHNTWMANSPYPLYTYKGGGAATSLYSSWTNNIFQHNNGGFFADGGLVGTAALNAFYPKHTWLQNVAAGAPNIYPPGTLRPTMLEFQRYVGPNGLLLPGSPYIGAATDGTDIGVDFSKLPKL